MPYFFYFSESSFKTAPYSSESETELVLDLMNLVGLSTLFLVPVTVEGTARNVSTQNIINFLLLTCSKYQISTIQSSPVSAVCLGKKVKFLISGPLIQPVSFNPS